MLVDTSVAVPLVWAAFETFSVLSRLPAPARRRPAVIARILAENFPASRYLAAEGSAALLASASDTGIAGGQVYDALVAAAAVEHGVALVTRDRRALSVSRALGVAVEILDS